ncbi:uncharacterized protein KGF55_002599 [Candida pseudojiufengensis]|uniref:uncharacterized protein n=1 Tax=Candida pseudojiufengensis TaxID=497109 RepID=UPI0022252DB5|nr:uncharacterized protein KGF55_002599 [Candida pseudojiufengensis]KAI5963719.1 hypothetical protein KGF55_002599 [Candida pseudojiufengensis]
MSKQDKPLLQVLDELTQLRASVSQFQATFKLIIEKSPSPEKFIQYLKLSENNNDILGEATSTIERLKGLIDTPQIKVAVRIRQLYEVEKLPFLTALSNVNFKTTSTNDQSLEKFLDVVSDFDDKKKKSKDTKKEDLTKSTDYYSYPPTLPLINDETLLIKICTDKSYRRISDFVESSSTKYNNSHNGKLAIKGKSILDLILIEILETKLPNLYENDLIVIKNRLISFEQLAKFSFGYNLIDSMKYNLSSNAEIEQKMKICGNIFLAYIAGLQNNGYSLEEIKTWLNKLYEPLIIDLESTTTPVAKIALIELNNLFKSITNLTKLPYENIKYEILEVKTDPYVAHVVINDEILGFGVSSISFEDAKDRAVMDVMDNQSKINKIFVMLKDNYMKNKIQYTTSASSPKIIQGENEIQNQSNIQSLGGDLSTTPMVAFAYAPPEQSHHDRDHIQAHQNLHQTLQSPFPQQQFQSQIDQSQSQSQSHQQQQQHQQPHPQQHLSQQHLAQQQQQPLQHSQSQQSLQYPSSQLPLQQLHQVQQQQQQYHTGTPAVYAHQQSYYQTSPTQLSQSPPHQFLPYNQIQHPTQSPIPSHMYQESNNNINHNGNPFNEPITCPIISLSIKDIDMKAKTDLYAKLGPLQLKADYIVEQKGSEYYTLCLCKGKQLGYGADFSKQKSGQKAAMAALSNQIALRELGVPIR